jgi:hypothetical protein
MVSASGHIVKQDLTTMIDTTVIMGYPKVRWCRQQERNLVKDLRVSMQRKKSNRYLKSLIIVARIGVDQYANVGTLAVKALCARPGLCGEKRLCFCNY